MISSVIARLNVESEMLSPLLEQISAHRGLEPGELIDYRLLPITIESASHHEMESITRWLQSRHGVEFVDVVFVHFENDEEERDTSLAE